MNKLVDLTGRKFGSLTVIKRAETHIKPSGQKVTMWECLCDCGERTVVTNGNLKSGNVKTCGNRQKHRPQREYEDLTGKRFGKLVVLEKYGSQVSKCGSSNTIWKCKCDCGNFTFAMSSNLKTGHTQSCGCWKSESQITHGMTGTRIYRIWKDMKTRCYQKSHKSYNDYGGRGITVCEEWKNSSDSFIEWAFSSGYQEHLTLDRIDANGNYEPSNCRWATRKEQGNNTRRNVFLEYNGKSQTISQWAEELGINKRTLYDRIKRGWSVNRALETK